MSLSETAVGMSVRIGFIVPASNTNLEPDCAKLMPSHVTAHFTRIGGYDVDAIPDENEMEHFGNVSLDEPVDLLMAAKMDAIGYGCLSATLSHGWKFDQQLCRKIKARAGVPAATAASAIVETLADIKATRIGFASPYVEALNQKAVSFFEEAGIKVVKFSSPDWPLTSVEQGCLASDDIFELACKADHPDADAIVIGCTDVRAMEIKPQLEQFLGKSVIASNQALISVCLSESEQRRRK